MRQGIFRKITLTHIPDRNRTAIDFVHVNGRSLYINWRMVVVVGGGNVIHHVKKKGNCPGGECPGEYVREAACPGKCPNRRHWHM